MRLEDIKLNRSTSRLCITVVVLCLLRTGWWRSSQEAGSQNGWRRPPSARRAAAEDGCQTATADPAPRPSPQKPKTRTATARAAKKTSERTTKTTRTRRTTTPAAPVRPLASKEVVTLCKSWIMNLKTNKLIVMFVCGISHQTCANSAVNIHDQSYECRCDEWPWQCSLLGPWRIFLS